MDEKQLGKLAKEIALHFIRITEQRTTPSIIKKHIAQTKTILKAGFTMEEIIEVMEYVIMVKKVDVYSMGYISACISNTLRELEQLKEADEMHRLKEEVKRQQEISFANQANEVFLDDDSTERNRKKAQTFSDQHRKRTKFNLDMFEGQ